MDHEMELKGCFHRIKNCAVELFSTMEEDLEMDDEDSWDLVGRDIRLKATFLYIDLSRVVACCEGEEHKKALTVLTNRFFYSMDEVRILLHLPPFRIKHVLVHYKFILLACKCSAIWYLSSWVP